MKRQELLNRLIGEVSNFLLEGNPLRLVISLHQEKDGVHLSFFDDCARSDTELKQIREALNPRRLRPELAEYYGSLAGHDTSWDARLKLIGWQIKGATVTNDDCGTRIDLWLGGEAFKPEDFTLEQRCSTLSET